jgi:hypothetical protein
MFFRAVARGALFVRVKGLSAELESPWSDVKKISIQ